MSDHHVEIEMPGGIRLGLDSLELARAYNAEARAPRRGNGLLGFSLPTREAVDERYASLTGEGYRGCQAPYDTFWGARYAIVEDPDGNQVGLMSPIDPARQTAPRNSPDGRDVSGILGAPQDPRPRSESP